MKGIGTNKVGINVLKCYVFTEMKQILFNIY